MLGMVLSWFAYWYQGHRRNHRRFLRYQVQDHPNIPDCFPSIAFWSWLRSRHPHPLQWNSRHHLIRSLRSLEVHLSVWSHFVKRRYVRLISVLQALIVLTWPPGGFGHHFWHLQSDFSPIWRSASSALSGSTPFAPQLPTFEGATSHIGVLLKTEWLRAAWLDPSTTHDPSHCLFRQVRLIL